MWHQGGNIALALLLFSVVSGMKYFTEKIEIKPLNHDVLCPSKLIGPGRYRNPYSPLHTIFTSDELTDAAYDGCNRKSLISEIKNLRICSSIKNLSPKIRETFCPYIKSIGPLRYEGTDFTPKDNGVLILWSLKPKYKDDLMKYYVVAEWVKDLKICSVLGAVRDIKVWSDNQFKSMGYTMCSAYLGELSPPTASPAADSYIHRMNNPGSSGKDETDYPRDRMSDYSGHSREILLAEFKDSSSKSPEELLRDLKGKAIMIEDDSVKKKKDNPRRGGSSSLVIN